MYATKLKKFLCRTCLSIIKGEGKLNIFDTEDLAKKLILCSALAVEATDEYPKYVCLECYEQILKFYGFQQMCCKSQEKFKELLRASEEEANINSDLLNDESEHKNDEICNNKDTAIVIVNIGKEKIILERKESPPKKKQNLRELQQKEVGKMDSQENLLGCENNSNHELYSEKALDFKTYENNISSCEEDNCEPDFNSYSGLEVKTLSETDSRSSSQELKTVQIHNHACDRCDQKFNAAEKLEAHKREHDGSPPYTCTYKGCSRSFSRWYFFNKHQKEHNAKQADTYKCDVDNCERVYKSKCVLNIHKRKCHNVGPALTCEICGKVFKSATASTRHSYTHIDKSQLPYVCEEVGCSRRFYTNDKLQMHKIRHSGIKNFVCPYCGMRKPTRNELKIHINYHTHERTWPCRFCPKVFNSGGNLKMHVQNIHEGVKDFACRFCKRTFAKAATRKYHERTHTGEKPHECEQCGRRFAQPAALITHRKIHLRQNTNIRKENKDNEDEVKDQMQNTTEIVDTIVKTEAMVEDVLNDNYTNLE